MLHGCLNAHCSSSCADKVLYPLVPLTLLTWVAISKSAFEGITDGLSASVSNMSVKDLFNRESEMPENLLSMVDGGGHMEREI